jgi:hypothetical protein
MVTVRGTGSKKKPLGRDVSTATPGQLSPDAAGSNVTAVPHCPGSVLGETSGGQVMAGGWTSSTSTWNEQLANCGVGPDVNAVHVTAVVPTGKNEPLAGLHPRNIPSVVGSGYVTTAPH